MSEKELARYQTLHLKLVIWGVEALSAEELEEWQSLRDKGTEKQIATVHDEAVEKLRRSFPVHYQPNKGELN